MSSANQYTAEQQSDYFRRSLFALRQREPDLQQLNALIGATVDKPVVEAVLHSQLAENSPDTALRRTRQLVFMALMERDLNGQAPLVEICHAMTTLAQLVTNCALQTCARELVGDFGTPRDDNRVPIDLIAVAMGKAGAQELNVSSDLDLVFLIRDEGRTDARTPKGGDARRGEIAASDFAHRVARRAIEMLAENTADGFVFRIDTRLRPNGDSGPLVCTLGALEVYLQVQGREWERFAWLKSNVMASTKLGDPSQLQADTRALTELVEPFVFRRYHDYRVFAALRDLHHQIRAEARKRDARRAGGFDVKLGRGGIREIEFVAQLFQIVRGGRDRILRNPATLPTLETLAERGLLQADETQDLARAYEFLRRCEHCLQYRDDQQTHFLAETDQEIEAVCAMLRMNRTQFMRELHRHLERVEAVFDNLLVDPASQNGTDLTEAQATDSQDALDPLTGETVSATGKTGETDQDEVQRKFEALRQGARYRSAPADAQQAIDILLGQAHQESISADCSTRLVALLETICRRPAYIALLAQYPVAFKRVLTLLEASQWAASYLAQHPLLLDELIDGNLFAPTDLAAWQNQLAIEIAAFFEPASQDTEASADVERQMDTAREWHHAQLFRILARELTGQVSIQAVADELSELADRTLKVALDSVWQVLPARFREDPQFAVIAYGRLGGKEIGYASDLDLVFLYDDSESEAAYAYSQLARRLNTFLSAQTSAGHLFEIDLRLRPNGEAGLLVTSLGGFEEYQRQSAWVWEHQALTRARYCAGDATLGEKFEQLRRQLISQPRDPAKLAADIADMRKRMHDGHPNHSDLFDLKHDHGGMVDVEFAVQFLILANANQFADMMDNVGNIALLERAAAFGLLAPAQAQQAADAYRHYRSVQHTLRLQGATYARVDPEGIKAHRQAVCNLWDSLIVTRQESDSTEPNSD